MDKGLRRVSSRRKTIFKTSFSKLQPLLNFKKGVFCLRLVVLICHLESKTVDFLEY